MNDSVVIDYSMGTKFGYRLLALVLLVAAMWLLVNVIRHNYTDDAAWLLASGKFEIALLLIAAAVYSFVQAGTRVEVARDRITRSNWLERDVVSTRDIIGYTEIKEVHEDSKGRMTRISTLTIDGADYGTLMSFSSTSSDRHYRSIVSTVHSFYPPSPPPYRQQRHLQADARRQHKEATLWTVLGLLITLPTLYYMGATAIEYIHQDERGYITIHIVRAFVDVIFFLFVGLGSIVYGQLFVKPA